MLPQRRDEPRPRSRGRDRGTGLVALVDGQRDLDAALEEVFVLTASLEREPWERYAEPRLKPRISLGRADGECAVHEIRSPWQLHQERIERRSVLNIQAACHVDRHVGRETHLAAEEGEDRLTVSDCGTRSCDALRVKEDREREVEVVSAARVAARSRTSDECLIERRSLRGEPHPFDRSERTHEEVEGFPYRDALRVGHLGLGRLGRRTCEVRACRTSAREVEGPGERDVEVDQGLAQGCDPRPRAHGEVGVVGGERPCADVERP